MHRKHIIISRIKVGVKKIPPNNNIEVRNRADDSSWLMSAIIFYKVGWHRKKYYSIIIELVLYLVYKAKRFPETRKHFVRKSNKNEISEYNNVIVEYDADQNGYVKTSYYSENLEMGGDYIYVKYKNKIWLW